MSNIKITSLEIENVKRVKAVSLDCSGPLTVIGGRNGQGKTSVLDSIMWTLGGDKFRPSKAVREGAEKATTKVTLSNGVTVERKGVNGSLHVTSPTGKGGQALLNEFVSQFALDLPKFMNVSGTDKAKLLLEVFPGLGKKLQALNEQEKALYNERTATGQIADRKAKYAKELPFIDGVPELPLSGAEMAEKLKAALSVNAHNDEIRRNVGKTEQQIKDEEYRLESIGKRVSDLKRQLAEAEKEFDAKRDSIAASKKTLETVKSQVSSLKDTDTTAIESELENIDKINAKIRANSEKSHAESEAAELKAQYNEMSQKIDAIRAERLKLLSGVKMPLSGLLIDEEGELVYQGAKWDCMSGSEQLRVATAICAAIKPACGFVLLDKLEAMDTDTLREFGEWLSERDLQAIGTRVGTGEENTIVIEDGMVVESYVDPEIDGEPEPVLNF